MRRLKRRTQTTPDNPPPAAAQPAAPPAPVAVVGNGSSGPPALPAKEGSFLSLMLGSDDKDSEAEKPRMSGLAVPYVSFYSSKEGSRGGKLTAAMIAQALGGSAAVGTPYVAFGTDIFSLAGSAFICLDEFYYWCRTDSSNQITEAWTSQVRGEKIRDGVLAMLLVLPGQSALHPELAPALLTISEFRGAQAPAIKRWVDGFRDAKSPEWAKQNGALAGGLQPRARVTGAFRPTQRTASSGFSYVHVDSQVSPITIPQIEALRAYETLETTEDEIREVNEEYVRRVEAIKAIAAQGGE